MAKMQNQTDVARLRHIFGDWLEQNLRSLSAPPRLRQWQERTFTLGPQMAAGARKALPRPRRRHRSRWGQWGRALSGAALGFGAGFAWQQWRKRPGADLTDKVVLIAGASRGLGLALAEEFALQGAKLALCAREAEKLEDARLRVAGLGAEVLAMPCDVTDRIQVQQMVDATIARFGRVDILVNNASTILVAPALNQTIADFRNEMDATFWGALHMIQAVLPQMRVRRAGRIVNITSVGGKVAVPHLLSYSAAKFALVGLSEGLRSELARAGVTVTTVAPGLMRTGSPRNAVIKGQQQAEYTWFKLAGALPFTSISASDAARQIVQATRRGDAEIVLSWQAQLLTWLHGLAPGLTADLLGLVNRVLPKPSDSLAAQTPRRGAQSETDLSRSFLTDLDQRAAARYQER